MTQNPQLPRLSLIVAMTPEQVIGANNALPWHLPADLAHFKATTLGCPVIMGRKTHESIGRPLQGRQNIVVSRNRGLFAPGCTVAGSLEEALGMAEHGRELFVIGGAALYETALPHADRLYLTEVRASIAGDTHFPPLNPSEWMEVSCTEYPRDARNAYDLSFRVLERKR